MRSTILTALMPKRRKSRNNDPIVEQNVTHESRRPIKFRYRVAAAAVLVTMAASAFSFACSSDSANPNATQLDPAAQFNLDTSTGVDSDPDIKVPDIPDVNGDTIFDVPDSDTGPTDVKPNDGKVGDSQDADSTKDTDGDTKDVLDGDDGLVGDASDVAEPQDAVGEVQDVPQEIEVVDADVLDVQDVEVDGPSDVPDTVDVTDTMEVDTTPDVPTDTMNDVLMDAMMDSVDTSDAQLDTEIDAEDVLDTLDTQDTLDVQDTEDTTPDVPDTVDVTDTMEVDTTPDVPVDTTMDTETLQDTTMDAEVDVPVDTLPDLTDSQDTTMDVDLDLEIGPDLPDLVDGETDSEISDAEVETDASGSNWFDLDWQYCVEFTVTGNHPAGYQHGINLDSTQTVNFNSDGGDVRFFEGGCGDPNVTVGFLNYWYESWSSPGEAALAWVKTQNPDVQTIAMYYGNVAAISMSDGFGVFEFFDDFEGDMLDPVLWTPGGSAAFSVTGGSVTIFEDSWITSQTGLAYLDGAFEFRGSVTGFGSYTDVGFGSLGFRETTLFRIHSDRVEYNYSGVEGTDDTLLGSPITDGVMAVNSIVRDADSLSHSVEGTTVFSIAGATTFDPADIRLFRFGAKTGATTGETMSVDWARFRMYMSSPPTYSPSSEFTPSDF